MNQDGYTLIEVLLALVIFSLSMLAALNLQSKSDTQNQANYWQAIAVQQVEFAVSALKSGDRSQFVEEWQQTATKQLPQGRAAITIDHNQELIEENWWDPIAQKRVAIHYKMAGPSF
ncbi:MAG: prepilin-type N-terminal cleavage/methylation domain-containing protein [Gammaproteobacteria bacterium]|nr:prepilin-type N-terminal cleavage/methylation domain-containing protein [Gammaproteobacteria bacterium]